MSNSLDENELRPNIRPWQPRFGIGTMLLLMLIVSVVAAGASYFVRAMQDGGRDAQLAFILFTIAAPLLLVVVVSVAQSIFGRR